ncbi:MAG: rhodanese-like domain-containing protein [Planctomycetota bacterium]
MSNIPRGYGFRPEHEIDPADAAAIAKGDSPGIILDVRFDDEIAIAAIDGSVNIPLPALEAEHEAVADALEDAGLTKADGTIAVMCHAGVRSTKAALFLQAMGYANAKSIVGGIDWWAQTIDTAMPRYAGGPGAWKSLG